MQKFTKPEKDVIALSAYTTNKKHIYTIDDWFECVSEHKKNRSRQIKLMSPLEMAKR